MNKVSDVEVEDIEKIIQYARNNLTEPRRDPMYPWVIVSSIENRLDKTDDERITMTNSDLRRMINGIARNEDSKDDISDDKLNSIKNIKELLDD